MEILVVGVIALVVFGPHRLPEIARTLGKYLAEFKRQANDLSNEFKLGLDEDDDEPAGEERFNRDRRFDDDEAEDDRDDADVVAAELEDVPGEGDGAGDEEPPADETSEIPPAEAQQRSVPTGSPTVATHEADDDAEVAVAGDEGSPEGEPGVRVLTGDEESRDEGAVRDATPATAPVPASEGNGATPAAEPAESDKWVAERDRDQQEIRE